MDKYEASVQSVDAALKRLNATLASYKLQDGSSNNAKGKPTNGSRAADSQDDAGTVKIPQERNAVTAPTGEERLPRDTVSDKIWDDLLSLRSTKPIREVCFV